MHKVWQRPARHDAPFRHGVDALQAVHSAAPVLAMQTLSVELVICTHALPDGHAAFGQPLQPVVPPQHVRQYASVFVPMQMPHGLQNSDSSHRSPGFPVGSQRPLTHVKPTAQVDWPVPVHWLVQGDVGAHSPPAIVEMQS